MHKGYLYIVIILAVSAFLVATFVGSPTADNESEPSSDPSQATPEPSTGTTTPADWERYQGEVLPLTFAHPPEADIRLENGRIKVTVLGPDNTTDSEITDGFTLFIGSDLELGDSLQALAETEYATARVPGEGVTPPQPHAVAGQTAYQFAVRTALGPVATHTIFTTDDTVVDTTATVIDPHERGYQAMVDRIIATISRQ